MRFRSGRLGVVLFCAPPFSGASAPKGEFIRRLDGSRISIEEADSFAKTTLAVAHAGAQIAVLDRGQVVWSVAFGLRRRDPGLPMDRETTTWAASITKSVFSTYVMQLVERQEALEVGVAYGVGWGLLTRTKFGPTLFKEGHGDGA